MPQYLRARIPGGTFFFTVTLADRSSNLLVDKIDVFRDVYRSVRIKFPFETIAVCILPDHLHTIWTLPAGDVDYPRRWNLIKGRFSRRLPSVATRAASKIAKREKGIWQRRYWEHVIRDETDLTRHIDYIHYNPVKHGLVSRVCDWPHSSFHRYAGRGDLPLDWAGDMREISDTFGE
jgi:putative transposase